MKPPSPLTPALGPTGSAAEALLYERIFGRVQVAPDWAQTLSALATNATLVHMMRSGTLLDVLCVNHLCHRAGLPTIRFVNHASDHALTHALLGGQLASSRPPDTERTLQDVVLAADSALLFLRAPQHDAAAQSQPDLLLALVQAQRRSNRPILLIPQTLVWGKLPSHKHQTLGDLLFGPAEDPGRLRVLASLALNPNDALLRAGPPFDLQEFMRDHASLADAAIADKVRYAMLRRIERERTVVLGPSTKTPARIRDEILRSPRLRPQLESAARASQKSVDQIREQAAKDLDQLIAAPSATLLGLMNRALDRVWNELYDGLIVDEEGMTRVLDASRRGTLVLFPSHKSHIDYVVLSDVFYARGLSPPIVAAGDNLSFWPLGPALRHAGAFFIHRALAGQKLYSALLAAYIRRLLLEGFTLEVFLEGGRSRTGKLLQPKLGMLSMIVDAAIAMNGHPIYFVPISIAYERVIEERAFVHELAGFEKQSEDIAGLLQAPKIFRSRYGRLFLQVGEILSFQELMEEARTASRSRTDGTLTPKERRTLIHNIATRTAHEINRVTVVTPSALTATALLCHRRRGLTKPALIELARVLMQALVKRGARMAAPLTEPTSPQLSASISEALQLLVDAKLVSHQRTGPETVYRVPSAQRIAVEYYKNSILHFFTPSALLAVVLLSKDGAAVTRETLLSETIALADRLTYELPGSTSSSEPWNATIDAMLAGGEIAEHEGAIVPAAGNVRHPELYAWMIRGSLESYRIALRGIHGLTPRPVTLKAWLKEALALGERMYLAGEIEVREAVSRDRLENALRSMHDAGLVRLQSEQNVAGGKLFSAERLAEEDALIKRYLP